MSRIRLQSIESKHKTSNPDFYVGAVVDSESGYLTPTLIEDTVDLDSFFDEFPYKDMYRSLIKNDIPVCILPTITRESRYNLSSLRLSNGLVTISHPKIDKEYRHISLSNLQNHSFSKTELDKNNSITITHSLKFYPRIVIEVEDKEIKANLNYKDEEIKITFSEKVSGTIWIESLPQIESDPDFIITDRFGKLGGSVTPEYKFEVPNEVIPEIVVTYDEGPNKGDKVEVHVVRTKELPDKNIITVTPKLPVHDLRYRIDVRIVPSGLLITRDALLETHIYHNSNRFPLFKFEKDGIESWAEVEYRTPNYTVISVSDPVGTLIRYNIISANTDFNFNLLNTHQTMFNLILDFTNVPYEQLIRRGSLTEPSNFLLIDTANERCLVSSGEWHGVTSNYYNTNAVYYFEEGSGSTVLEKKDNTLTKFKDWFNSRYSNSCSNLEDQLILFIKRVIKKIGTPKLDQFGHQPFISDWKEVFIEEVYKWDFWLETNENVVRLFRKILKKYTETVLLTITSLSQDIKDLNLDNSKLLLEYTTPIQNLNHYRFDNLMVTDSYNLTQDKLCNFTERDKVIDIYSKVKGFKGKKIYVNIKSIRNYRGVYDIVVSNDIISENYTVRLYDVGDIPIETIHITEINNRSKLIYLYLYNYWIAGRLIDSILFDEELYGEPYDTNNLRKITDLKLPEGTFYLDRTLDETITTESRTASLEIYKASDWYPDLFLVDSLPDDLKYPEKILDLVRWNEDQDNSIFSQALIKLNSHQLNNEWFGIDEKLLSQDNKILYFFEDLTIDGIKYPSYYPYILNIISQKYLYLPKGKILYHPFCGVKGCTILLNKYKNLSESSLIEKHVDNYYKLKCKHLNYKGELKEYHLHGELSGNEMKIFSDSNSTVEIDSYEVDWDLKTFLRDKHINYIDLDNLKYSYDTLFEVPGQRAIFIVQFILSKYTREVYKIKHELTGIDYHEIRARLEEVNSKCMRLMPLVISSRLETVQEDNRLNVTFSIIVDTIINKEYKLDYVLNI